MHVIQLLDPFLAAPDVEIVEAALPETAGSVARRFLPEGQLIRVARPSADILIINKNELVEAGGVEPPSEKPCNTKSTCLSRSEGFADRAQNRQDALPASPMISPPHCGPKRGNQPTV